MSQIEGIADHFLSARSHAGPRRIGVIGVENILPASFLAAQLALKWGRAGRRALVVDGEEGKVDVGNFLSGRPLPLLEDQEEKGAIGIAGAPGARLVPFRLTLDRLSYVPPAGWKKIQREEEESDLLLVTFPRGEILSSWAPLLRAFHAVIVQTTVREEDQAACYRMLRFLYRSNPFLRVHLVCVPSLEDRPRRMSEGVQFYERLSRLAEKFLHQETAGPYLMMLEPQFVYALLDRRLPDPPPPSLGPLLERLTETLLAEEPPLDRSVFPGFFQSLEAIDPDPPSQWAAPDLFKRLKCYIPLDMKVGPKNAALLLNWERRVIVGEVAGERLENALVRGIEAIGWAHDHLSILARLYGKKVDGALTPHLLLIAPDYPPDFVRGLLRLAFPIVLFRAVRGRGELFLEEISPCAAPSFSEELSTGEREGVYLKGATT